MVNYVILNYKYINIYIIKLRFVTHISYDFKQGSYNKDVIKTAAMVLILHGH